MSTHQDFPAFPTTVPAARQYPEVLSKLDITSFDIPGSPPSNGNLTMDASAGSVFTVSLTENILNWEIENPTDGQEITVIWRQNNPGGWTVAAAFNLVGLVAPTTAANSTTVQSFTYDASASFGSPPVGTWFASTSSGGGGSSVTLQTNSTNNADQTTLNLANSSSVNMTNTTGGTVEASLPTSGVTPGSYTTADITVNSAGIITSASNGAGGGGGGGTIKTTDYLAVSGDSGTLLAFNTSSGGSFTLVQTATGSSSSATFGGAPTVGNLIIVTTASTNGSPPSLTGGPCASYTQVEGTTNRDDGYYISMFYGIVNNGSTTISASGLGSFSGVSAYEWSGNATSSVLDTSSSISGGVSTTVGSPVTTSVAGDLVWSIAFDKNAPSGFTVNPSWTTIPNSGTSNNWIMYNQVGAAGLYEPTVAFGGASGWACITAAFKPAAGVTLTLTLPSSPPSSTWNIWTNNIGLGTLVIDPNGLNLNGVGSSIDCALNQGHYITTDGSDYLYV